MPPEIMRAYVERLRASGGLMEPTVVSVAVLTLTSLAFFRVALLPEFGRELAMSTFQLGAVTTTFAVGRLVADLPGGHLADRVPAGLLLGTSAIGVAVGSLVLGSAGTLLPVYLSSMVLGMASATTNATGMTFFSNAAGAEHRGTSMAIFSAGLLGGQAVGPAAAGLIASAAGWRVSMYVAAGVASVLAAAVLVASRAKGAGRGRVVPEDASARTGHRPRLASMLVLQSVSFVMFLTLGSIPQTLVPIIGSEELGLGAAAIGLALGVGGLSRFVGTFIGGRVSDRVGRKAALVPGLLVQALGVGLLAVTPSVVSWVAAIVVMSVASYAIAVAGTIIGDLSDPARVGSQLGRFRFIGDLGLVIGPVSVGAIFEGFGRAAAVGTVAALLAAVALLCARLLPETR